MEKHYVNGVAFEYRVDEPAGEVRAGSEPTVVLLHGFPLHARIWAGVAQRLSRHFRVIRPNLRGFGTMTSVEAFTIESLAADVHGLLKGLGDLPCVLAGLSMGGYVALSFAEQFAEDLAGLGLVDTKAEADDEAGRQKRDAMIQRVREQGVSAVVSQMHPNLLASSTIERDPGVAEVLMRVMLDTPALTIEHACRAMRDRKDYRDLLGRITVPTGVIVGAEDALTPPEQARQLAAHIPGATCTVIDGAGHMSPLETPAAVADAIRAVVRRAAGGRSK